MASDLPDVIERYVADVDEYVRNLERAAREADHFGDTQSEAREAVQRMGHAAQEAAERAARSQAKAAREAERLAEGTGDVERAARAAAKAQRDLERAEMAQARAARASAQQVDNEAEQYQELAREAARAAAAQRLAMLRASGQVKEHNALLRRLREEYGGFGDDAEHSFREIESRGKKAFGSIADIATASGGKIQVMLALLPLAASLAGGAMTLAFGAGLSGIAIMAASKSKEVQAEFSGLKKHIVTTVQEWAEPWEDTLVHIADITENTFDQFNLAPVFAEMAPVVEEFFQSVADGALYFRATLDAFGGAFTRVLGVLGPQMDEILGNIATGLTDIADAVADNPESIAELATDLSTLVKWGEQAIAMLTRFNSVVPATGVVHWFNQIKDAAGGAGGEVTGSMADIAQAVDAVEGAYNAAAASTGKANTAQSASQQIMRLASQSAQRLKASLDALAGKELGYREAMASYGQAVMQVNQSLRENGRAHGYMTAKGNANEQALSNLATTAQDAAVKMRDNGKSAQEVARYMEAARAKFVKTALAMGYTRSEAVSTANKLYGVRDAAKSIPMKRNMRVDADTEAARRKVREMVAWINSQVAQIAVRTLQGRAAGGPVGYAMGGPVGSIPGFPGGGPVRGPGTSTSDSILARLSNGEFVMNAVATRAFGPVLALMNKVGASAPRVTSSRDTTRTTVGGRGPRAVEQGSYSIAPPPKTYAQLPIAPPAATIIHVTNQNFHVAGSVWSERELLDVVQRKAADRNARNPQLAQFGSR
ncbi:hypothetical protein [Actinomadura litoris]|uniref:Uncharacterized protein n=1 Tax=Actinomadura litoris TaxID=2678616 RepID=A0A7K1L3I9_9ACTN|nr:hypothetical protein [Actinomadura litoris]MUN38991.1 hypothetical protein [Actinomadura litoris]